jgi:peptide/nickel transport system ATP-binding protein
LTGPILEISHLRVEFPTRQGPLVALNDVSLLLQPGETLGIVGESGAGKSLTGSAVIGLMNGAARITGGEIRLAGQRLDTLSDREMRAIRGKRIGTIFQDPLTSLDPVLAIGAQLIETLRTHLDLTARDARQRAAELLAETGIPDPDRRLSSYPHEFSGGMRQRVVIALALAGEPELVIADEPTTALDVSVQAQIIALLRRLCAHRRTSVLLITHDMGVIAQMANRVAVMYAGRVIEIGEVAAIVGRPLHPYSQGLMRAIPPLSHRPARLDQIGGSMPRLSAIPAGCAFHPRCAQAMPRCATHVPAMRAMPASQVACHLYGAAA